MNRYDELLEAAKAYRPGQVEAQMRVLARDDRFAAVVAWIAGNLDGFAAAASAQRLADSHGQLAHAAGSHHALRVLDGQLRNAIQPARQAVPPADQPEA